MFWQRFSPDHWNWKLYVVIALFLTALNLFGPKGVLHWLHLKNEYSRLNVDHENLKSELQHIREEIAQFRKSPTFRERAIRQELGYLKTNEVSVEFVDSVEQRNP